MPYAEELEKEKEGDTSIGVQSLTAHDDKSSLADNIPGKEITYLTSYLFVASKRRPQSGDHSCTFFRTSFLSTFLHFTYT